MNIDNELADRLDDLAEERAGNVHAEVVGHLNAAWEHLFDYQSGAACCDPLSRAADEVRAAVETLSLLEKRLLRLDEETSAHAAHELGLLWSATK